MLQEFDSEGAGASWRALGLKISGCKRWCPNDLRVFAPAARMLTHSLKVLLLIHILCLDNVSELLLYLLEFGHIVFLTTEHFFFILVEQVSFSEVVHSSLFTVWQSFLQSYFFIQSPFGFEAYSTVWQSKFSDLEFLLFNGGFQF